MIETHPLSDQQLLSMLLGQDIASALPKRSLPELFGLWGPACLCAEDGEAAYQALPILSAARELYIRALHTQMEEERPKVTSLQVVIEFLTSKMSHLEHEVFWGLFLNAQNRLVASGELFRGSVTQTAVYPREVIKKALQHNATALIVAHNHPSGHCQPSNADKKLTQILKKALKEVEVCLIDHVIVAGLNTFSFAAHGLL